MRGGGPRRRCSGWVTVLFTAICSPRRRSSSARPRGAGSSPPSLPAGTAAVHPQHGRVCVCRPPVPVCAETVLYKTKLSYARTVCGNLSCSKTLAPHCWAIKLQKTEIIELVGAQLFVFTLHLWLEAVGPCEFPTRSHFSSLFRGRAARQAASVFGDAANAVKRHIIFSLGMLPKQQRNVMRAVGSHRSTYLWEELTKARITLPLCLRCHPQEKWACRKSPWQLCVLKRQTARSHCRFMGCYFTACCRET